MKIRKIEATDVTNYLDMLLKLDNETQFMMFEPGERDTDIEVVKNAIEKSIYGDDLTLVATVEEEIIGFLSLERGIYKRIKHSGYVVIGILEKFRGHGIGGKLFLELDKWARDNNIARLELSVMCSNKVARHLYEKNGFDIEGIKRDSMIIDGKFVDEYYMAKLYKD